MKKFKAKVMLSVLILAILTAGLPGIASASLGDDICNLLHLPCGQTESAPINSQDDRYSVLIVQLEQLNTPQAIESLGKIPSNYGNSVKVHISDYNRDFYVVRDRGVVQDYSAYDQQVIVSSSQIQKMYPYFAKGYVTENDMNHLRVIYTMGIDYPSSGWA